MLWMGFVQWMMFGAHAEETAAPFNPDALQEWWQAAGQLRLGDTAYRVTEPLQFKDGVCDVSLTKGMIVPVYTGIAPVSERVVGVVFTGEGELAVRFRKS